jgi:hypothetical protein
MRVRRSRLLQREQQLQREQEREKEENEGMRKDLERRKRAVQRRGAPALARRNDVSMRCGCAAARHKLLHGVLKREMKGV